MSPEMKKVDAIVAAKGSTREMAIPILQAIQETFRYIPEEVIAHIAKTTDMTESQLFGIATFYAQFRLEPVGEKIIKVCHGTACHVSGAEGITDALESRLGIEDGENTPDMKYTLTHVACVGCCSLAPVVMVDNKTFGSLDRVKAAKVIDKLEH
jgi:NADH:ubiquinone oxidoreductase subunit E